MTRIEVKKPFDIRAKIIFDETVRLADEEYHENIDNAWEEYTKKVRAAGILLHQNCPPNCWHPSSSYEKPKAVEKREERIA